MKTKVIQGNTRRVKDLGIGLFRSFIREDGKPIYFAFVAKKGDRYLQSDEVQKEYFDSGLIENNLDNLYNLDKVTILMELFETDVTQYSLPQTTSKSYPQKYKGVEFKIRSLFEYPMMDLFKSRDTTAGLDHLSQEERENHIELCMEMYNDIEQLTFMFDLNEEELKLIQTIRLELFALQYEE